MRAGGTGLRGGGDEAVLLDEGVFGFGEGLARDLGGDGGVGGGGDRVGFVVEGGEGFEGDGLGGPDLEFVGFGPELESGLQAGGDEGGGGGAEAAGDVDVERGRAMTSPGRGAGRKAQNSPSELSGY